MGIKHSKKQRKEQPTEEAGAPAEEEVPKVEEEDEVQIEDPSNPLKIELYPENKPRYTFEKKPVIEMLPKDILEHSLNPKQKLAYMESNVPLLNGFYTAHINHYPIRIKPDDIWLLIVQALSHHINVNSESLRYNFVNFEGKQKLTVKYPISRLEEVDKKILENFSEQINEQMKQYLGDELVDLLTPNFSTTTYDSKIVAKISVMGAFKKYFEYHMDLCGCGIPYIILEGTADDYKEII
jgi:DNA mismatch repair ATPase MutL